MSDSHIWHVRHLRDGILEHGDETKVRHLEDGRLGVLYRQQKSTLQRTLLMATIVLLSFIPARC